MPELQLRPDIAAAYSRVKNKFGMKNEMKHLAEYLQQGEVVEELTGGLLKGRGNGLLALTDRRVVFLFHGVINKGLEEFRLQQLTSVGMTGGLMWAAINLTVAGATQSIENVDKTDAKRVVPAIRDAISRAQASPVATPVASEGPDVIAQIAKLKELHDAGILTDEEFGAKKAELLARL